MIYMPNSLEVKSTNVYKLLRNSPKIKQLGGWIDVYRGNNRKKLIVQFGWWSYECYLKKCFTIKYWKKPGDNTTQSLEWPKFFLYFSSIHSKF